MSKIENITDGPQIPKQQPNVKTNENTGFKDALEAALNNEPSAAAPKKELNSLGEIQPTTVNKIEPSNRGFMDKTNFLIDKLDNYSKDLENPEKTLKEIEPLIASIKDDAQNLILEATDSPDESLNKIATETAIKANTEFIKFNRGDYI